MDPRQKLKNIIDQKKKLHERINEIDNTDISENKHDEEQLNQLLLRKKILEDQKKKQEEYLKLEKEYLQRKKQAERERQLQKIKNQKRMLELQAAMKKVVFEGIKQKVKGMNSQQLMMRGYLANGGQIQGKPSQNNFKDAFEGYLLQDGPQKIKPKYDLNKLNEQRLQIFEKKQEAIMKQILLKELAASDEPIEIDVLNMNRQQLVAELQRREIDIDDFMHPVQKEDIIENYDMIKNQAVNRITQKRKNIFEERAEKESYERYKRQLREDVNSLPFKSQQVVKRLLYDLFDNICDDYDKRHVNRSREDQEQISRKLQEQYDQLWNRNLVQELSDSIVDAMMEDIRKEMARESAEEVAKLNQFAHLKTEECFMGALGEGDIAGRLQQLCNYKFPLTFMNEDENHISKPKNDQYLKKLDNAENNVFETQQNTVNLVNDIVLLSQEEKYMKNVKNVSKNEIQNKNEEAIYHYDKILYSITRHGIKGVHTGKFYHSFSHSIQNPIRVSKINKNWLIQSDSIVALITPWNRQELGSPIGSRISNPCGNISYSSLYPVLTLLGSPCSVILGFQKGQLLKYNFNLNRITSRQTSLTQYIPVIQHAKSGDEPPFPLDNRDYIPIQQEKGKPTDQIHQFRQFFQHHAEPIIFLEFYRVDKAISIDRGLKCALWQYGKQRGSSCFQPVFKFQIRSNYQLYKEDQNPRYKDIFPVSSSPESPEQMYQKYMQTQSFLKLQLYNNPKKEIAYFKSPTWQQEEGEKAIWKITYKQSRKQVNKILQSYYNVLQGAITGEQARLVNDTIYVLCHREHVIRNDLKTVKIYSWSIPQKRLGRVGLQIDMYRDQKISNFLILPQGLKGVEMELAVVVNSGRVLLFSLVSGQLLKNINDQLSVVSGEKQRYYFKTVIGASDQGFIYGVTTNTVMELYLDDINSINDRNRLNKTIDNVKRKYFR